MTKNEINEPTLADIYAIARTTQAAVPAALRKFASDVVLQVEDFPADDICDEMELESPFDILGLYQGISLAEKQMEASGTMPDMVFLFRRPILDYWCESGEDLVHIVRHVVIHEIGHHFGFSDEVMEAIEKEAEAEEHAAKE